MPNNTDAEYSMAVQVFPKSFIQSLVNFLIIMAFVFLALPAFASNCEDLAKLKLDHGRITTAGTVVHGTFTPPGGKPIVDLPDFCRIAATLNPTANSNIRVEIWMPQSGWNERIEGTGNGGLAGSINYAPLAVGLRHGYAVANTDMGTSTPVGSDASIFINRPERWADWGYRATHEMTVLTKTLVSIYYGRNAKRAYFAGCSTGGEQALMEAQRFPDDYDGIVGGAAANNRTGVHIGILWNFAVPQKSPASYLPPAKIAMLSKAVLNSCDALDGVRDGVISDPPKCNFDPSVLACKTDDKEDCLTNAQIDTVTKIYSGPTNPRTGQSLYPGLAKGSEMGWAKQTAPPGATMPAPYAPLFEWVFGLTWNWRGFDFDQDVNALNTDLSSIVNATSPDIDTFREHGHKLLMYHGWSDPLVAPAEAINYYNAVVVRSGDQDSVDSFYRLFMIPGMEHCGGGQSPHDFDGLSSMTQWVEKGIAPDRIIATRPAAIEGAPMATQLLCSYPRVAKYRDSGDVNDASSYTCVAPNYKLVRGTSK